MNIKKAVGSLIVLFLFVSTAYSESIVFQGVPAVNGGTEIKGDTFLHFFIKPQVAT